MTFSELLTQVKIWEGYRYNAYYDSAGVKTVGYGFTASVFPDGIVPSTISKDTADELLSMVLYSYFEKVHDKLLKWGYDPAVIVAIELPLTDFAYNCGMGNLNKLTDNGKRTATEITEYIVKYCYAGGKVLKGLQNRRNWEQSEIIKALGTIKAEKKPTVRELQQWLNDNKGAGLAVDGIFGTKTLTAVYSALGIK